MIPTHLINIKVTKIIHIILKQINRIILLFLVLKKKNYIIYLSQLLTCIIYVIYKNKIYKFMKRIKKQYA